MAAPQKQSGEKSLYQRLGGYDTIAAVVNDFGRRFSEDPQLKPFIVGFSDDTGKRQAQLFIEFFCEQAGGRCTYIGRDMKTTHAGMTITESHWKAFMEHLAASLDAAKVQSKEKAEALAIFTMLRPEIGITVK
jgi:hemoglobin